MLQTLKVIWSQAEMEFFGYTEKSKNIENPQPDRLIEMTICAKPTELRSVAQFLLAAADDMEKSGAAFEHQHYESGSASDPELVVFNPDATY